MTPHAGLDGPSKTIIVEPIERPTTAPAQTPEPVREPAPVKPEKVPA